MKKQAFAWERSKKWLLPLIAGIMVVLALSTGSILQGALSMLLFSLGTVQLLDGHDQKQHQCRRLKRI